MEDSSGRFTAFGPGHRLWTPTVASLQHGHRAPVNDLRNASFKNRVSIESLGFGSCFFCFEQFPASIIATWADGNQTALCPHCHVDAVVPGTPPLSDLRAAHLSAFG